MSSSSPASSTTTPVIQDTSIAAPSHPKPAFTPREHSISVAGDAGPSSTILQPFDGITQEPSDDVPGVADDESQYPTGTKFWFICLALALTLILGALDSNILATAVPAITDHFHTLADVGWYSSAYRLCSSSLQFFFGKMYHLFSLRLVFIISVLVFALGSFLSAIAPTSIAFIIGRAVTGVACSGVIAGAFAILVRLLPLRKRPVYTSLFGTVEALSVIAAPILGGVITEKLNWRWCFYINLPLCAVVLLALFFFLPELNVPKARTMTRKEILRELDLIGTLVFLPSMTCLFIALTWAGVRYPWNDPRIIGLLVAFALLLLVFVADQYVKGDHATLPPRIVRNRNVIAAFVFTSGTAAALAILEYYLPTYYQAVRGESPAHSGLLMLPVVLGFIFGVLINGTATTIVGYYTPFMLTASFLMPLADGLVTLFFSASSSSSSSSSSPIALPLAHLIPLTAFVGFAAGLGFQSPQTAVQTVLTPTDAPLGLAVVLFAQAFGPALAVALAQTVFTARLAANLGRFVPGGLSVARVESVGLTELVNSLVGGAGGATLAEVVAALAESLVQTWYFAVGLAAVTIIGSATMEWRSVKQKRS